MKQMIDKATGHCLRNSAGALLNAGPFEKGPQYLFRLEKLAGNLARRQRMAGVIGIDTFDGFSDFVGRFERDQTVATAPEKVRETGFLDNDGPPGSEVTAAPVAEPTGVEPNVLVLRNRELAFGTPDVVAVKAVVRAKIVRRAKSPAVFNELFAGCFVLDVGCELECFPRVPWRGHEVKELARFAPQI